MKSRHVMRQHGPRLKPVVPDSAPYFDSGGMSSELNNKKSPAGKLPIRHWILRTETNSPENSSRMSSGWRRTFGNARSFVGNSMGGLRGGSSLASWGVAGTLAYFLWVRPSQKLRQEQEERAALAAASDSYRYVEKRKPVPDPQETGLVYGNKNPGKKPE